MRFLKNTCTVRLYIIGHSIHKHTLSEMQTSFQRWNLSQMALVYNFWARVNFQELNDRFCENAQVFDTHRLVLSFIFGLQKHRHAPRFKLFYIPMTWIIT